MERTYQTVLTISTKDISIRSEAIGWGADSGNEAHKEIVKRGTVDFHVGAIRSLREYHCFPTVLHALGKGYKLLAPPEKYFENIDGKETAFWEWWLVRDEEEE